jgi:cytochrome c biogenesis protein CcmG/thiol:disulfide interchange protein DsbE
MPGPKPPKPKPSAPKSQPKSGVPSWVLFAGIGGVVALIVIVVVATVLANGGTSSNSSSSSTTPQQQRFEIGNTVSVSGAALPQLPQSGPDPAIGKTAPTLAGITFDGSTVTVPQTGPSVVVFLAHWCPHCQREVPVISKLRSNGQWPNNVGLSSVVTATNAERDNYPPSTWLRRQKWDAPVLLDTKSGTASDAYGLSFPFMVWLDANNVVQLRTAGEVPEAELRVLLQRLANGESLTE